MSRLVSLTLVTAVTTLMAIAPGVASAQPQQPLAEDNIWGGKAHQPTQTEVTQRERSAGLGTSSQQRQATDQELEALYQKLMHGTQQSRD